MEGSQKFRNPFQIWLSQNIYFFPKLLFKNYRWKCFILKISSSMNSTVSEEGKTSCHNCSSVFPVLVRNGVLKYFIFLREILSFKLFGFNSQRNWGKGNVFIWFQMVSMFGCEGIKIMALIYSDSKCTVVDKSHPFQIQT